MAVVVEVEDLVMMAEEVVVVGLGSRAGAYWAPKEEVVEGSAPSAVMEAEKED
jgi:hypothetical protein